MTLVCKLDLDIVKMYMCTKNEATTFNSSKVTALNRQTDRQTEKMDRQTDKRTDAHTHTDSQSQLKLLPIRIRGW